MPRPALLFTALIGLVTAGVGSILAFSAAPRAAAEQARLAGLEPLDAVDLASVPEGAEVIASGILRDNPVATRYELVAHSVDRWVVDTEDDGDEVGSWFVEELEIPSLVLETTGGQIRTAAAQTRILEGSLREFLEPGDETLTAPYASRDLPDGSRRVLGLRNGDLVTVVGVKGRTGATIRPESLFAGSYESLLAERAGNARALRIVGFIILAVGLAVAGAAAYGLRA